jgi:uncharacterized membrane protein YkvA (DUF1232 family)
MHSPKLDSFQAPKPPSPRPQASSQRSPAKQYQLEELPRFPSTLFKFKEYDGAKALTALLLVLSFVYFLAGFLGFLLDHTPWLKELLPLAAPSASVAKATWWQFWKPIGATVSSITSYVDLAFRLFIFLCSYCLTWATFDPRNIEGYVMGFFNACIGIGYILFPADVIPDLIPVVGTLDDVFLGGGVLLLGLSSLYRNKLRDVKTETILELIDDGNHQKALQMLLEDKGITVKEK